MQSLQTTTPKSKKASSFETYKEKQQRLARATATPAGQKPLATAAMKKPKILKKKLDFESSEEDIGIPPTKTIKIFQTGTEPAIPGSPSQFPSSTSYASSSGFEIPHAPTDPALQYLTSMPLKPQKKMDQTAEQYYAEVENWKLDLLQWQALHTVAAAARSQQPMLPQASTKPKKMKLHKNLGTLQRYTISLSKSLPFYMWYKSFAREMSALDLDEPEIVYNLKWWVADECWRNWSEYLPEDKAWSLQTLLDELEIKFPDQFTPLQHQDQFRACIQITDDVNLYSQNKEHKFRLAYPGIEPQGSTEFFYHWSRGLWKEFRKKLVAKNIEDYTLALQHCRRWELAYKQVEGGYSQLMRKPQNSSNHPSTTTTAPPKQEICKNFVETGQCKYGSKCKYKHPPMKNEQTKPPAPKSNNSDVSQLCKRPGCANLPPHPWTQCKNPGAPCSICQATNHRRFYCPQAQCTKCQKKGHIATVCGIPKKA